MPLPQPYPVIVFALLIIASLGMGWQAIILAISAPYLNADDLVVLISAMALYAIIRYWIGGRDA